ncbi:CorA family divalent cation transporter [Microvirga massiliensis]
MVASGDEMNFEHIPELAWRFGYPCAFVLMVISAVIRFVYVEHEGWL